jgi:type IV secretion system protein TrbL
MKRARSLFILLLLAAATLFLAGEAAAQVRCDIEANNALDCILTSFKVATESWQSSLAGFAITLFWILAAIEFSWAAIQLAFRGADLGEWLSALVNQVMFIGFFAALLQFSAEWASAIIASFQQAANIAGGAGLLRPSDIFDVGIRLATSLYDASSNWNIVHNLVLVIAGFFILIAFGLITAYLIVALVESFIVISAGVLFMGFGGSRWTKDYAVRIFQYCMSIGAKLFVIQLLAGLMIAVVEPWASLAQGTSSLSAAPLTSIFVLVGISIIFVAIVSIIPQMVQTLINGSGVAGGGERLYATTAGMVTGSVAGAVGGVMATRSARRLASEQLAAAEADGSAPATGLRRQAQLASGTARNLGKHAAADLGGRLCGRMARWASAMDSERQSLRARPRATGERQMRPEGPARGDQPNTSAGVSPDRDDGKS